MVLLVSPKDKYATLRLVEEAQKSNLSLEVLDVNELGRQNFAIDPQPFDVLYIGNRILFRRNYWLAKQFIKRQKIVIDERAIGENLILIRKLLTKS